MVMPCSVMVVARNLWTHFFTNILRHKSAINAGRSETHCCWNSLSFRDSTIHQILLNRGLAHEISNPTCRSGLLGLSVNSIRSLVPRVFIAFVQSAFSIFSDYPQIPYQMRTIIPLKKLGEG